MAHLPDLIRDLGLILMAAAAVTLLFRALKQPVVLGYLIAGFLVGPHFGFLPTVKDQKSIAIWAEIGVIFMLFGLGLEFSFRKLSRVGKSASITAIFEILLMLGLGALTGQILGWSKMDSLFLGAILSISSTTIIVRAFDELGLKARNFVNLVFGVLVVEDLLAILLLVILSSVAVSQTLGGSELLVSVFRVGFFLILWFLLGIYLLPSLLGRMRTHMSDETTLIVALGLCLMMVVVATEAGLSAALGAFVMGSLLAETREGRRIEHLIHPVKDLFSAIFFVSVGMLINPTLLWQHIDSILLITMVVIVGKFISTALGALLSGRSVRHSVQAGMSLAQIGEFSFIIATLGASLKVTSDFLYPIAVSVSAITTFTTPYLIRWADPLHAWIDRRLPTSVKSSLSRYEATMSRTSESRILSILWRAYGLKMVLNTVPIVAITFAMRRYALPYAERWLSDLWLPARPAMLGITLVLCAPFLWAVFIGIRAHASAYSREITEQLRRLQIGVVMVRFVTGAALVGFILSNFSSVLAFSGVVVTSLAALGVAFFSRFSETLYRGIERRFISNLTENERLELERKAALPELAPWSATLAEFTLSHSSPFVAKALQDCQLKERFGVTIAMIERGHARILAPKRGEILLPGDRLYLIGTDEQLASSRPQIESVTPITLAPVDPNFGLASLQLQSTDPYVGKAIRDCGLREQLHALIVGIERNGKRILNPDSALKLESGDLLWIVGDRGKLKKLSSLEGGQPSIDKRSQNA
jgi:CPA2 family monovalent cation:H+ antiporter-2